MDIDEVLEKLGCPTEEENVAEDIRRAFGGRSYVKRQFFSLTDHEQLSYGWKDFVNEVKHQRRYLFMLPGKDESENISEEIPSHKMLHELGHVVDGVDLIKEMKAGTQWFRVRIDDPEKRFSTASELGTVPKDKACCSNRMSPAGIPMFYGAADEVTAIAETYIAKAGRKAVATVGTFETARDFVILDLTQLPPVPSAYDRRSRHLRPGIAFIEEFVETLIQPITKNGREHIDYVPTQIVTEYFRCVHKTSSGDPINGILYRSSKDARGKCCVLFFENDKCCEATDGWEADARNCLGLREVLRKEM